LSIPHEYHQTEGFKQLATQIREYFETKKIPVYEKEAKETDALFPPEQKKTKKALMQVLTLQYPQLTLCYHKELRNKNRYYIKVFEAVAVAALLEQEN
jgi:hypothetical protein